MRRTEFGAEYKEIQCGQFEFVALLRHPGCNVSVELVLRRDVQKKIWTHESSVYDC